MRPDRVLPPGGSPEEIGDLFEAMLTDLHRLGAALAGVVEVFDPLERDADGTWACRCCGASAARKADVRHGTGCVWVDAVLLVGSDLTPPVEGRLVHLRRDGLLWLINRCVFHPRGWALAVDSYGRWSLLGDGVEVWDMGEHIPQDDLRAAAERVLRPTVDAPWAG